jgi:hypothetical protein
VNPLWGSRCWGHSGEAVEIFLDEKNFIIQSIFVEESLWRNGLEP